MEIILKEDYPHLGKKGQVVKVADGYARNYLIPRNIAMLNVSGNKSAVEVELQFEEIKENKGNAEAEEVKEKIDGKEFKIKAKAGKEGKLYGSITKQDIVDLLEKEGYIIDKKVMDIQDHIKEAGSYEIQLNLFKDVKPHINLIVEGESSEAEEESANIKDESPRKEEKSSEVAEESLEVKNESAEEEEISSEEEESVEFEAIEEEAFEPESEENEFEGVDDSQKNERRI